MNVRRSASHDTTASVNIHVRDLAQMFNSLDASPFWDRDLDRAAAEFIEDEFAEKRAAGIDVITLGIGDPDVPTFPPIVHAF